MSFNKDLSLVSEFSTFTLSFSIHFCLPRSRREKLNIVFPVYSAVCGVLISFSNILQIKPINPLTFTEFRSFCVNCFERIIDSFARRKVLTSLPGKQQNQEEYLKGCLYLSCRLWHYSMTGGSLLNFKETICFFKIIIAFKK